MTVIIISQKERLTSTPSHKRLGKKKFPWLCSNLLTILDLVVDLPVFRSSTLVRNNMAKVSDDADWQRGGEEGEVGKLQESTYLSFSME
jgi:hypothetical protein